MLTEQVKQKVLQHHQELKDSGKLLPQQQQDQYYTSFRSRFGPDQLSKLDGERLLEAMHGGKGSMMYWLEFKNDDEFSTISFGGIGGGSALKFGVFRRKESGNWAVAGKGNIPEEITVGQAVEVAQKQRDQLLRGIDLLGTLAGDAGDDEYRTLQDNLERLAPDVSNFAWAHKYFHLIFSRQAGRFSQRRLATVLPAETAPTATASKGPLRLCGPVCGDCQAAWDSDKPVDLNVVLVVRKQASILESRHQRWQATEESLGHDAGRRLRGDRMVGVGRPFLA